MVVYHYHTFYIDLANLFNYMVLMEENFIQVALHMVAIKPLKDIMVKATITNTFLKALANK